MNVQAGIQILTAGTFKTMWSAATQAVVHGVIVWRKAAGIIQTQLHALLLQDQRDKTAVGMQEIIIVMKRAAGIIVVQTNQLVQEILKV